MKLLFIDVETTGIDNTQNSIWSISAIVVIDGKVMDRLNLYMRPTTEFHDDALKLSKYSLEEIMEFPDHDDCFILFVEMLEKYVDRYDSKDKFFFAGFYSKFDEQYVRDWFTKNNDKYYGSWFHSGTIDVAGLALYALQEHRHKMKNFKLVTVAELFGIEIEAHDSASDINATYEIYKELNKNIIPINL